MIVCNVVRPDIGCVGGIIWDGGDEGCQELLPYVSEGADFRLVIRGCPETRTLLEAYLESDHGRLCLDRATEQAVFDFYFLCGKWEVQTL